MLGQLGGMMWRKAAVEIIHITSPSSYLCPEATQGFAKEPSWIQLEGSVGSIDFDFQAFLSRNIGEISLFVFLF